MNGFAFREMIVNGWPVLSILLFGSIVSLAVVWDRIMTFRRAKLDAPGFAKVIKKIIDEQGVAKAVEYCEGFTQPVATVIHAVLIQPGNRAEKERVIQYNIQKRIRELENYVPVLGTIGSIAPFVGLFGTVIGIIKAFHAISVNLGGGPEVVANGIAEALITTAMGLFVAIPAVVAYNYFVNKTRRMAEEIDLVAQEIVDKISTHKEWK